MKVISLINNKGGVAKTTSSIQLGGYLATLGYNVVVIDFDPQMSLTLRMACDNLNYDIADFVFDHKDPSSFEAKQIGDNLFIMKGSEELESNQHLIDAIAFRNKLKNELAECDFVIMDCKPGLMHDSYMTSNEAALIASDYIIIPMEPNSDSLKGIEKIFTSYNRIKPQNPDLEMLGFFFTKTKPNEIVTNSIFAKFTEILETIGAERFLLESSIRENTEIRKAEMLYKSIFDYNPNSTGAWDYKALGEEVLLKIKNQ